ncbi:MAG: hypothetical protein GWN00_17305, partial [Aliifodinibius sp.]|nr:hypothetical protein [Fodinibius sp.]NIV12370.1 hypothetical protein [Fodinibius sp.]NIY26494.1 hypothetical protein [Fodinibius sp.]
MIIKTIGSDKVNEYLLKEAADQVRPDRYHVSYASFLKNCHTLDDVETKITMLKDVLGKNLPSVWNTFFSSVKQRMHP